MCKYKVWITPEMNIFWALEHINLSVISIKDDCYSLFPATNSILSFLPINFHKTLKQHTKMYLYIVS